MSGLHDLASAAFSLLDSEEAHRLAISGLKAGFGPKDPHVDDPVLATRLAGLDLTNPVGLAAGFDKNAEAANAMLRAGFGFAECGTVTPLPQEGNPKPRLFRLTPDRAVINRLGFNNEGLEVFAGRMASRPRKGVVGANIGANKDTTDRADDYVKGLTRLWGLADYFTVNISSPNTPGLRGLQTRAALEELLGRLREAREGLKADGDFPVFLKVAPDLTDVEIAAITEATFAHGLDALMVGNTTLSRPDSLRSSSRSEAGGLSGAPLMGPSTDILRRFYEAAEGRIPLIGVGGIASGADAYAKIRSGATAVQLYSAMIYEGPGLVVKVKADLAARLKAEGFSAVSEAVGAALR